MRHSVTTGSLGSMTSVGMKKEMGWVRLSHSQPSKMPTLKERRARVRARARLGCGTKGEEANAGWATRSGRPRG